jgi:hypothetical protein
MMRRVNAHFLYFGAGLLSLGAVVIAALFATKENEEMS